jgi:arylsulfatase A-like enzyme
LYPYDQHVPLILYGAGVKKGKYDAPATPADLAPSLAALAGVPMSGTDGHALADAFARHVSTR